MAVIFGDESLYYLSLPNWVPASVRVASQHLNNNIQLRTSLIFNKNKTREKTDPFGLFCVMTGFHPSTIWSISRFSQTAIVKLEIPNLFFCSVYKRQAGRKWLLEGIIITIISSRVFLWLKLSFTHEGSEFTYFLIQIIDVLTLWQTQGCGKGLRGNHI